MISIKVSFKILNIQKNKCYQDRDSTLDRKGELRSNHKIESYNRPILQKLKKNEIKLNYIKCSRIFEVKQV